MVNVGEINIGGSIQTMEIERGLQRIEVGFSHIETKAKSVNSDFERMNQQTKSLAIKLSLMAVVGAGAMISLAKGSPALAGSMAKINVITGKLSRSLGEALAPAFSLVSEAFNSFAGWIDANKGTISDFSENVVGGLTLGVNTLSDAWGSLMNLRVPLLDIKVGEGLKFLITNFGAELIAGLIAKKFIGGPAGIAAAGVVSIAKSESEGLGAATVGGLTGLTVGMPFGPAGMAVGFGVGSLIGRGVDLYLKFLNRKNTTMSTEDII